MNLRDRWSDLRERLDELTEVDWSDPSWWGFAAGALALQGFARRPSAEAGDRHLYHAANGGPLSDNYMGRDARPPRDAAHSIALAVARGAAALDVLAEFDGSLPDQPLRVGLEYEDGWLRRRPVDGHDRSVAFVTPVGVQVGELTARTEEALATALGEVVAGRAAAPALLRRVDPRSREATPAVVSVAVGTLPLRSVQHAHRLAWTVGGGPWLGIADAPPIEAVTTCHLAVDGYGHARITSEVLARRRHDLAALIAAAERGLGGARAPVPSLPEPPNAAPLSFAGRTLPADSGGFAEQSHAFGRALERTFRSTMRRDTGHTPTFQVAVAPGDPGDPERRKRRALHALVALRMRDGECESLADYRLRLGPLLERELAGLGLLPQLSLGIARAPLPRRVRRWLLKSRHRSHARIPPYEVLSGRGRFSSLRFHPDERPSPPLYAASSPTLLVTPDDPLGSVVLSLIHHGDCLTATVAGTGVVGSHEAAGVFLDAWCEELAGSSSENP